uniref:Uncharacterized protein n=1 Tax=Meloidogyne javanica TaxID=6303 RepID=A0A915ML38_MELJA
MARLWWAELCLASLPLPMLKRNRPKPILNQSIRIKQNSKNKNGSGGAIVVQQSLRKLEQRLAEEREFSE